ncbi:hypothetical protein CI102_14754 [Trichoderma harzianum]|nr:hypothetical protein CI102_14754 [Trichoderma harzianum]
MFLFQRTCSFATTVFLLIALVGAQTCYAPDGSETTDIPCDTGSFPTFCCPVISACLSNGLCQTKNNGPLGRGTCTDQTWKSTACTHQCISESEGGSTNVIQCFPNSLGNFCCANPSTSRSTACCNDENNLFHLGDLASASSLPWATSVTENPTSVATLSSPSETSVSPTTSAGTVPLATTPGGGSTSPAPSTTVIAAGTVTAISDSGSLSPSLSSNSTGHSGVTGNGTTTSSSPLPTGAKVGIAIGVALAAIIIAFIITAAINVLRRKLRDEETQRHVDDLLARQSTTINAVNKGLRDGNIISMGAVKMQPQAGFESDHAPIPVTPHTQTADGSFMKQTININVRGEEQQEYRKHPPTRPRVAANFTPGIPAPHSYQPSRPYP